MLSEVFSQQEEEVTWSKERGFCQVGLLVVGWVIAVSRCRLAFPSLLMETAERDVHTKSGVEEERE